MVLKDWLPPVIYDNLFRIRKDGAGYFYAFGSNKDPFGDIDELKSYQEVPEVNAIINMKARAWSNMRLKEVNKEELKHPHRKDRRLLNC